MTVRKLLAAIVSAAIGAATVAVLLQTFPGLRDALSSNQQTPPQ
jgi:hypothetical protein